MADGEKLKIYVCYLCEAEFKEVGLLTAHMREHDSPSKQDKGKPKGPKRRPPKAPFLVTEDHSSNWKGQILPTLPKPMKLTTPLPQPKKKSENPKELALQRALKVQKLIKSRELAPEKKKQKSTEEDLSDESSMIPFGPTIITGEPDGFVCPHMLEDNQDLMIGSKKVAYTADQKLIKRKKYDVAFDDDISLNIKKLQEDGISGAYTTNSGGGKCEMCPECFRYFSNAATLKVHLRTHELPKDIMCPFCEEVFHQRHILREHLLSEHEDAAASLVCGECGKVFTRADSLKSHMVRMHFSEGGLQCSICSKVFPSQATLETHLRIHTGERPFRCTVCNKTFVQKIHLRTHLKKMHGIEETLSHPCRLCNEMFSDRVALREHHMSVHSLTYGEYKQAVARMKKDGQLPGSHPKAVRIVEPNFTYQTVPAYGLADETVPQRGKAMKPHRKNRPIHMFSDGGGGPTIMDALDNDTFSPGSMGKGPSSRGLDEMKMVENAFKVADEMDFMSDGTSLMISPQDAQAPDDYYTLPVLMNSSVQKVHSMPGTSKDSGMSTLQELQVAELDSAEELGEFDDAEFGQVSKFENIRNIKVESL